jgi:hypothetical protein
MSRLGTKDIRKLKYSLFVHSGGFKLVLPPLPVYRISGLVLCALEIFFVEASGLESRYIRESRS